MLPITEYSLPIEYPQNVLHGPVVPEELRLTVLPPTTLNINTPDDANTPLTWRPLWLRRVVLIGFMAVFLSIIIAIESLLNISNRNHGLATSTSSEHYLWTYGPTAFLTGLSALWARTEFQSKLVAPWVRLSQHPAPASRTLLLDYISQFPPLAMFHALHNKDFAVAIAITVSIIIKVLIILSTGLISLSLTAVDRQFSMVLRDNFIDSSAKLSTVGNLAWYLQDMGTRDLMLTDGISSDYAFQSVQTNLPETTETRVTVDGLINSFNCSPLKLISAFNVSMGMDHEYFMVSFTSSSCNASVVNLADMAAYGSLPTYTLFARFKQIQCDGVESDAGKRVLVIFGNMTYPDSYRQGVLAKSTQLLCIPTYTIHKVEITRNGTQNFTVKAQDGASNRSLDSVSAWDILNAQLIATQPSYLRIEEVEVTFSTERLSLDGYLDAGFLNQLDAGTQPSSLFEPDFLQQTVTTYYRWIGAIVAKQSLMHIVSTDVVGFATVQEGRLKVYPRVAHGMAILVAISLSLIGLMFFTVPTKCILPQKLSTVLDMALLLSHSPQLLAQLRNAGACGSEYLAQYLGHSEFQSVLVPKLTPTGAQFTIVNTGVSEGENTTPFPQVSSKPYCPPVLRTTWRSLVCLILASLIFILEMLLQKSKIQNGLSDIEGNQYIHYAWSTVPALTVGGLAMVISAIDSETRLLAPYAILARNVAVGRLEQLELSDSTIPEVVWKEARLKSIWLFATTTAFLVASFFTTFSASVYQELSVLASTPMVLGTNESFALKDGPEWGYLVSPSLIFGGNYSFPRFTYNNLAFPGLVPITGLPNSSSTFNASTVLISTVIPALRERKNCRLYNSTQIRTKITSGDSSDQYNLTIALYFESQDITRCLNGSLDQPCGPYFFETDIFDNTTYFGIVPNPGDFTGSLYIWGRVGHDPKPGIQNIAVAACISSYETVDVDVTFIGTALDFYAHNPPRPLEDTVRNSTYSNVIGQDAAPSTGTFQADVSPALLDPFFSTVVTSPWAIPISALGDPSTNINVTEAIKLHSGIYMAQLIANHRGPATESNVLIAKSKNNDSCLVYNATVTSAEGQRRIVQDATSTHILAALLAFALVLSIIGWITSPPTSILPRRATSIASVMALVAGGNIPSRLPIDFPLKTPEEVAVALDAAETTLWIGWGTLPDEEGMVYGGGNEGGISQFGIFTIEKEEMELVRKPERGPWKRLMDIVTRKTKPIRTKDKNP